jgi:hypothetical protein
MMATKDKKNPIAKFAPVRFVCSRWPFLKLRTAVETDESKTAIHFEKGHFTATSKAQLAIVEGAEGYGSAIVRVRTKEGQPPSVEESAELAALEELETLMPKVNKGMVSSRSMGS